MKIDFEKENILSRMSNEGSPLQLALFRIILALQIFYASNSELLDLLQVVDGTHKPTVFPSFVDEYIKDISVPYLRVAVQILSILTVFGLFTRFVIPSLFLCFLFLFSFWYSHFDAPVQWLYIWFPLLILSFSRCSDSLSIDKYFGLIRSKTKLVVKSAYRWPVELISGWFAYIYLAAGLAKIFPIEKGINWLNGGTSHKIIYDRFLDSALFYMFEKPFFDYSENDWVFSVLSLGSLFIELSCIVIFLTNRFNKPIMALVISMHFFLYLTGVPGFMQTALILCICLIKPESFLHFQNKFPKLLAW